MNTQVCVLRNRIDGLTLERTFPELPGYFNLLAFRIFFGIKGLKPLIRIRGVEHPEAVISFYEAKGKRSSRKVAWISSSQSIGTRLFFITDQDYDSILFRLAEICMEKQSSELQ